jgi:hypothetical protein
MSKFWENLKDKEIWKISMMVVLLCVILVWSGYTINTQWGSLYKNNPEELTNRKMTKIKAQTNYSLDMKTCVLNDLGQLYEEALSKYIVDHGLNIGQERIEKDTLYYRLINIAMNDVCENITIERYIHNNDLYRYTNKADWDAFKKNVSELYIREGQQILRIYYDNTKVVMPLKDWLSLGGRMIAETVVKNTDRLMEDLKTESLIYYNSTKR